MTRKSLMLIDNGKIAGKLDPTHNIRIMGAPCCSFCLGIGDFHTGECATNKEKHEAFLARKKKLTDGNPNMPSQKPTRRGKPIGMRERGRARHPQGEQPVGAEGGRELGAGAKHEGAVYILV